MKKNLLLLAAPALLFGWGNTYYSAFMNEGGFFNQNLQYGATDTEYTVGYLNSPSTRWQQKNNFVLFIPNGTKMMNMTFQIDGSYKSIDGFMTINNVPNDDIKMTDTVVQFNQAGANAFSLMEQGKTIYYLGQPSVNISAANLNINSLDKWLVFKTSNRYYCDPTIGRRALRAGSMTVDGDYTPAVSSSAPSSASASSYTTNTGFLPIIQNGSSSSTAPVVTGDNSNGGCCYPDTYDAGMTWAVNISFTMDRAYVDSQVTAIATGCEDSNASDGNTSKICTFIKNKSTLTGGSVSINGSTFNTYSGDPALNFSVSTPADTTNYPPVCTQGSSAVATSSSPSSSALYSSTPSSTIQSCNQNVFSKATASGWNLVGAAEDGCTIDGIKSLGANVVWIYKNGRWSNENTSINKWDGFWIKK